MEKKSNNLAWVEISKSALLHNIAFFKELLPETAVLSPVVKANAYGHSLELVTSVLKEAGITKICVFSFPEALQVKKIYPEAEVLILGGILKNHLQEAISCGLAFAVYNTDLLQEVIKLAQLLNYPAKIHLKLETGTNRLGFREEELDNLIALLQANQKKVVIEGIFTHFANIEDSTNHFFAMRQWGKFLYLTQKISEKLAVKPLKHYACSAASLLFGETVEGIVRLGISLYGLWPSRETYLSYLLKYGERRMQKAIRPVLTWKTQVLQVKEVYPGETVGYGLTYQVTRRGRIAILPIGYWDGYDRGLSNKAYVLIKGKRAPVRGRICMNLCMVDISDIEDVRAGEEVVLLGKNGEETLSAEQLAYWMDTINYEVVTRINPQLPRYLVD